MAAASSQRPTRARTEESTGRRGDCRCFRRQLQANVSRFAGLHRVALRLVSALDRDRVLNRDFPDELRSTTIADLFDDAIMIAGIYKHYLAQLRGDRAFLVG